VVVVVVVVVWLPLGLFWVCDIVLLFGDVELWSCVVVCAAATPKASNSVATEIPNVRMV
jgi:hypothetical protein